MPKQKRGILGAKKDPKNQILFFSRNGEEWPSDDSDDSDYLPSDLEDEINVPSKRKKKHDEKQKKKKVLKKENTKTDNLDIYVNLPTLPTEIWLKIFQDVVSIAGALPFLCRAQKVCSHWRDLAEHPSLWRKVDLSYGWIKAKEETLRKLCDNRLSHCEDINLSNWTLSNGLRLVAQNCRFLQCINLSQCKKLNADGVSALADNCTQLRDIDVSNTGITSVSLKDLIVKRCGELQRIDIGYNNKLPGFTTVLDTIMKCSKLTVLDISNIENVPTYIYIDIEAFQRSCPKLKILRMGNNRYRGVTKTDDELENSPGFPELEEFMFPDLTRKHSMHITITTEVFKRILHKSPKLKVLDIRGRCNECYSALLDLPATDVESLHIGTISTCLDDPYMDLLMKWRHSLKTVDLSWIQNIELGIESLTDGPPIPLERIQLTGSNIITKDLQSLLDRSPKLNYIQLESCRNLYRGIKRLYKDDQDDNIALLRRKLKKI